MIPETEIILRVLAAAVMGAVVGFERERHNQPAGLRTHIILVIGAALAMTLSINIAMQFRPAVSGDPARLAAQVISGIGFLGAGAILRYGTSVRGLTTATSLWTMAVVGLAVGAGYYLIGAAATALLILALSILDGVEKHLIRSKISVPVQITYLDDPDMYKKVREIVDQHSMQVLSFSIYKDLVNKTSTLEAVLHTRENGIVEELVREINVLPGVQQFRVGGSIFPGLEKTRQD